jgi:hypothetical protein
LGQIPVNAADDPKEHLLLPSLKKLQQAQQTAAAARK